MHAETGAACDTENGLPATVPVPVRAVIPVFAVTLNVSVPDPVRPVPFWNARKGLVLVALHAQLVCVVTVMVPLATASDTLIVAGLIALLPLVLTNVVGGANGRADEPPPVSRPTQKGFTCDW